MASIWRFFGQSEPEIQKQPEITEEEKNEAISKVADAMLWTIEPVAHYWFLFLREASSIFHFALQDENSLREAVEELFWSGEIFVAFCSNAGKTASQSLLTNPEWIFDPCSAVDLSYNPASFAFGVRREHLQNERVTQLMARVLLSGFVPVPRIFEHFKRVLGFMGSIRSHMPAILSSKPNHSTSESHERVSVDTMNEIIDAAMRSIIPNLFSFLEVFFSMDSVRWIEEEQTVHGCEKMHIVFPFDMNRLEREYPGMAFLIKHISYLTVRVKAHHESSLGSEDDNMLMDLSISPAALEIKLLISGCDLVFFDTFHNPIVDESGALKIFPLFLGENEEMHFSGNIEGELKLWGKRVLLPSIRYSFHVSHFATSPNEEMESTKCTCWWNNRENCSEERNPDQYPELVREIYERTKMSCGMACDHNQNGIKFQFRLVEVSRCTGEFILNMLFPIYRLRQLLVEEFELVIWLYPLQCAKDSHIEHNIDLSDNLADLLPWLHLSHSSVDTQVKENDYSPIGMKLHRDGRIDQENLSQGCAHHDWWTEISFKAQMPEVSRLFNAFMRRFIPDRVVENFKIFLHLLNASSQDISSICSRIPVYDN